MQDPATAYVRSMDCVQIKQNVENDCNVMVSFQITSCNLPKSVWFEFVRTPIRPKSSKFVSCIIGVNFTIMHNAFFYFSTFLLPDWADWTFRKSALFHFSASRKPDFTFRLFAGGRKMAICFSAIRKVQSMKRFYNNCATYFLLFWILSPWRPKSGHLRFRLS